MKRSMLKLRRLASVLAIYIVVLSGSPSDATIVVAWGDNTHGQTNVPVIGTDVVAVGAGSFYEVVLQSDGTVRAWGSYWDRDYIPMTVPPGLSNVVAISAGWAHWLALLKNGHVVSWGRNYWGEGTVPRDLTNATAVAAGEDHSLALRGDGTVVGFGYGLSGETTPPAHLTDAVAIAAGNSFSLALRKNGTVIGWGWNDYGQTSIPSGLTNVVAIAAGGDHGLALTSDGRVMIWGDQTNVPPDLTNAVAIATSRGHNVALRRDGTVLVWTDSSDAETVPTGLTNVVSVSGGGWQGGWHSVALRSDSSPFIWDSPKADQTAFTGQNVRLDIQAVGIPPVTYQWQRHGTNIPGAISSSLVLCNVDLDNSDDYEVTVTDGRGSIGRTFGLSVIDSVPFAVAQPTDQTAIVTKPVTFKIEANGSWPLSFQWRFNGQPIAGATNSSLTLSGVNLGDEGSYSVDVSNEFGSFISSNVTLAVSPVVAWGDFGAAQSTVPTLITDVVAIATGKALPGTPSLGGHSLMLLNDGRVLAAGRNDFGQANVPATLSNVILIAAGKNHSLAVRAEGTVAAWGDNSYGQTDVPEGLSNVVALAAGTEHNLAVTADGDLVVWGSSFDVAPNVHDVVAVSAGRRHSLALRRDGTVVAWGWNDWGQISVPQGLSNVVAIAAGYNYSLALHDSGRAIAWGDVDGNWPQSNIVAVAAGDTHAVFLRHDGTVLGAFSRADFAEDQLDIPPNLTSVAAIAAGGNRTLALVKRPSPALVLINPHFENDEFVFYLSTIRGKSYWLEATDSLSRTFTTIRPPFPGDGTMRSFRERITISPQYFYRVRVQD